MNMACDDCSHANKSQSGPVSPKGSSNGMHKSDKFRIMTSLERYMLKNIEDQRVEMESKRAEAKTASVKTHENVNEMTSLIEQSKTGQEFHLTKAKRNWVKFYP